MEHPAGVARHARRRQGIAGRLEAWLAKHADIAGGGLPAARWWPFAVKTFKFEPDAFVHELVDSIIGDNYPVPDRMLVHNERIVHEYLQWAMCGDPAPRRQVRPLRGRGRHGGDVLHLQVAEGQPPAQPGDTIALGTPIFTPYLEMTHLEDYALQRGQHRRRRRRTASSSPTPSSRSWRIRKIKAFFLVNPGNPTGVALSKETIGKIASLVKTKRPDLMLLTDDVYGTFVPASARCSASCRTTRSASTRTRSTSAARAGGSASSRSTRTTSTTR